MRIFVFVVAAAMMLIATNFADAKCYTKNIGDAPSGSDKAALNTLKNRTKALSGVEKMEVANILAYPDAEDKTIEAKGVMLTGVLLNYHHEGPESPNCHSKTRKDYHIWIGSREAQGSETLDGLRDKSVVVELTPNIQQIHSKWASKLSTLKGKRVCISGWLMYDPEHPNQIGKTRGTLWEVHPIIGIGEVGNDGACKGWL